MPMLDDMERRRKHDYAEDEMLNKVQLAAALGVSSRTIDRWIEAGEAPPYVRLPRNRLRWKWGDVQTWLAARREGD
jgi:predicted DNA-binding transcriptional regulator AlpA